MKAKDVDLFEKVNSQLQQLHNEISILSKSKPDNPINAFKLGFINERLEEANTILIGEFKPLKNFTLFDTHALPTNSDIVMIISQYLDCLEAWRCANIVCYSYKWQWHTDDSFTIETKPPSRFRKT